MNIKTAPKPQALYSARIRWLARRYHLTEFHAGVIVSHFWEGRQHG